MLLRVFLRVGRGIFNTPDPFGCGYFRIRGGQALNLHRIKTGSLAAGSGHGFGAEMEILLIAMVCVSMNLLGNEENHICFNGCARQAG